MRRGASVTAEAVCLLRAAGGDDPYAERFLGPVFRGALAVWRAARRAGLPVDAATLGMEATVRARHRFIDEALLEALARGVEQVVLLGAGYDARPWRFADALAGRALFEIDHPATARERARRAASLPPTGARRIALDLATGDLGPALLDAGFDPARPSFFVWEGVAMYLERAAARETLARVAALMAPGSEIAFDVWSPGADRGAAAALERAGLLVVRLLGEPVTFALAPAELPVFLAGAGLALVEAVSTADRARRDGLDRAYDGLTLVRARPAAAAH